MKDKEHDHNDDANAQEHNCQTGEQMESCDSKQQGDKPNVANETQELPESTINNELMKKLNEATAEAARNKDLYLRSVADLDTYRRKVRREREELSKFAIQPLLEMLIPSLDNLDIALKSAEKADKNSAWLEGILMVRNQFSKVFEEFGVREFGKVGKEFNPNEEECVSHLPSDTVPENHIISVMRPGYSIHGRVMRPAAVIVSAGKPNK